MGLFSALFEIKIWGMVLVAVMFLFVGVMLLIDGLFNPNNHTIKGLHDASKEGIRQNQQGMHEFQKWRLK